ncbi:MAG TPA: efflux RND transporter permease subunit [Bryobacteraceae bacterium]|nr:efflux RND transporter permease subunit [Bryobacteraceae bacterium]
MSIAGLCVQRPVFAVMLISFLVVLGIFSFRDLGVDLFPRTDPATVTITVPLPGATAEEVSTQVILPLEEAVSSVSGLDELTSEASEGSARITCKFVLERDTEGAAQDVREKVSAAIRFLPVNALPPTIAKDDPDSDPVLSLLISGGSNLRETTEIADKQVKRALETVNGVGEVDLTGGRLRQIRVFADAEKLNAHELTIDQLETAVQNQNVETPGGTIRRGASKIGVRTLGRIDAADQFNDIIVASVGGTQVRVRDVGRAEDGFAEPTTWNMLHGKEAVVLDVRRQTGTNTLQVIDAVKAKVRELRSVLPRGITVEFIRDNSTFIRASVQSLEEHLLMGSLLASMVVLLFIRNLRTVLIAAVAIPTSIVATFTLLRVMNFTLNNMTLLALTLAVGIVIDDSIVILENIVRHVEDKGLAPIQAAIEATKEIMLPVTASTLSLVIIFVPIAFTTGYARRYLNEFGWTMAFAVIVSMLVSFTLTPMLCSRLLKRSPGKAAGPDDLAGTAGSRTKTGAPAHERSSKENAFFRGIDKGYGNLLEWALNHRMVVVLVAVGALSLTYPLNQFVGRDFIPPDDQSELTAVFDAPVGTSLDGTAAIATKLAQVIEHSPGVLFVWASVLNQDNHGQLYIRLADPSQRRFSIGDAADSIRAILAQPAYQDLRAQVLIPSVLGSSADYGTIRPLVLGPDFFGAAEIAERAAGEMRKVPGLVDVSAEVNLNTPELQVHIDRQRASDLGVRTADIANTVRLMVAGTDRISTYKEGAEQYDVTIQLLPEQQRDPTVLARLMVPSAKVGQVRLDNIAALERGVGPTIIDRYNRQFQVALTANNEASLPFDAAVREIRNTIEAVPHPGYALQFTGTVKILDETTRSLIVAFLLACIFMYMVLAAQFESLLHPFIIMLSLPLSVPFALMTLWFTHRTLNLWSALGVFLLLGIVKKNGILQVEYTNRLRRQGYALREAIMEANHVRLRPILMTTMSIVAGLVPTALGIGAGAGQRSAIAITIIGGQSLCLLLSLLITPVAYSLFGELEERRATRHAVEPVGETVGPSH